MAKTSLFFLSFIYIYSKEKEHSSEQFLQGRPLPSHPAILLKYGFALKIKKIKLYLHNAKLSQFLFIFCIDATMLNQ